MTGRFDRRSDERNNDDKKRNSSIGYIHGGSPQTKKLNDEKGKTVHRNKEKPSDIEVRKSLNFKTSQEPGNTKT
jgi:hypothetical protein